MVSTVASCSILRRSIRYRTRGQYTMPGGLWRPSGALSRFET